MALTLRSVHLCTLDGGWIRPETEGHLDSSKIITEKEIHATSYWNVKSGNSYELHYRNIEDRRQNFKEMVLKVGEQQIVPTFSLI